MEKKSSAKSSRKTSRKVKELPVQPIYSRLESVPVEIRWKFLLELSYKDVVSTCSASKKLNTICSDERFWRQYSEMRGWKKDLPEDTWRQTAILNTIGKAKNAASWRGSILNDVVWNIGKPPSINNIATNLPEEEWNKIIFRDPVKISVPLLARKRSKVYKIFTTKMNTPVGVTLGNLLEQIYRNIWDLRATDVLEIPDEIAEDPNFYIRRPYFEGLERPETSVDQDYDLRLG